MSEYILTEIYSIFFANPLNIVVNNKIKKFFKSSEDAIMSFFLYVYWDT